MVQDEPGTVQVEEGNGSTTSSGIEQESQLRRASNGQAEAFSFSLACHCRPTSRRESHLADGPEDPIVDHARFSFSFSLAFRSRPCEMSFPVLTKFLGCCSRDTSHLFSGIPYLLNQNSSTRIEGRDVVRPTSHCKEDSGPIIT